MSKAKVLLKSSEFTRADAVGVIFRKYGLNVPEEKGSKLADDLFKKETGKESNLKETKANFKYGFRLLRGYLGKDAVNGKTETPKAETKAKKTETKADAETKAE